MNVSKKRNKVFFAIIICLLIAFVLLFNPNTGSWSLKELMDFGHVFLFGLIAILVLKLIDRGQGLSGNRVKAWVITMFLGVFVEVVQLGMKDRFFEFSDLMNDAIGAFAFLAIFSVYSKPLRALTVRILSVVLILSAGIPFYIVIFDEAYARLNFPLINSFEKPFEISLWQEDNAGIVRSQKFPAEGSCSALVSFLPGEYSTICKEGFVHDWRGYKTFSADIYLPGDSDLRITLRINDKMHDNEFSDRFNGRILLKPGLNHISINLDDIRKSPAKRQMDMSDVTRICFFAAGLSKPETVYLDNIRLE
jgi:hypothetical protein